VSAGSGASMQDDVDDDNDDDDDDSAAAAADDDIWSNKTHADRRLKHEYRLLRDLMTDYEPAALPAVDKSDVVTVKMGIALFQIRELVRNFVCYRSAYCSYNVQITHLIYGLNPSGLCIILRIV